METAAEDVPSGPPLVSSVISTEDDAIAVLMVHAVETVRPELLTAVDTIPVDARGSVRSIALRARALFERLPRPLRAAMRLPATFPKWLLAAALVALVAGFVSESLTRGAAFHILYNPLVLLLVWNVVIIAVMAAARVRGLVARPAQSHAFENRVRPGFPASSQVDATRSVDDEPEHRWWSTQRIGELLMRIPPLREAPTEYVVVVKRFVSDYVPATSALQKARVELLLHCGAISLIVGAIAGTYLKGLIFDYHTIWQSTFLRDPTTVALVLNVLLWPGFLALHGHLLSTADIAPLMTGEGVLAASWIHAVVISVVALAVLPRLVLASAAFAKIVRSRKRVAIALPREYLAEITKYERDRLRDELRARVEPLVASLARDIAEYVGTTLFDQRIGAVVERFRAEGGTIAALEDAIKAECEAFQPELVEHVNGQHGIAARLRDWANDLAVANFRHEAVGEGADADTLSGSLPSSVADEMTDTISLALSGVLVAMAATISGGLGHHLGLAIVATLLHTTGPIGLLIGAVAGVVVSVGIYAGGRDALESTLRTSHIPAFVARLAIRDAKLQEARRKAVEEVEALVRRNCEQVCNAAIDEIGDRY